MRDWTAKPFTRGLRFIDGGKDIAVDSVSSYKSILKKQGILLDQNQRRQRIKSDLDTLAAKVGGVVSDDEALIN